MISIFSNKLRSVVIPKWLIAVIAAALVLLFFVPETAAAQAEDPAFTEILINAQHLLTITLRILNMLFWPALLMIGGLLDNELIFGGQMGEALRGIWVNMRNFVNVLFVLILIVIAVYNVLGLGDKGGAFQALQLKTAFPKFAIALIVVNFSFLGAKVVLDFANVLTTAVFSLPVTSTDFKGAKEDFRGLICREGVPLRKLYCNADATLNATGESFFSVAGRNNLGLIMAVSFGKLADQHLVRRGAEGLLELTFNVIYGIVLYVIYATSFIILFAVLLVRIAVLWVLVALSPLIALGIVIPQLTQFAGGEGGNLGQTFLKHAVSPIIIGLFMSIGYIMINTLRGEQGISGGYFSSVQIDAIDPKALVSGMSDLQEMLAAAAVAAVIWTGAGVAAKGTVAEKFSEGLRGYVSQFGKWAAKLPMYLQAIPVGEGGAKVSLAGLMADKAKIERELGRHAETSGVLKETGPSYTAIDNIGPKNDEKDLAKALKENVGALRDNPEKISQALQRMGNVRLSKEFDKAKSIQEKASVLATDPKIGKLLSDIGITSAAEMANMAVNAPRPKLGIREDLREALERKEEPAAKSHAAAQDGIRKGLGGSFDDFKNLGSAYAGITQQQFQGIQNDYNAVIVTLPENVQGAFEFFKEGDAFDFSSVKTRLEAVKELKQALDNNSVPGSIVKQDVIPPEFGQLLVKGKQITNPELQRFLQQNNYMPQEESAGTPGAPEE